MAWDSFTDHFAGCLRRRFEGHAAAYFPHGAVDSASIDKGMTGLYNPIVVVCIVRHLEVRFFTCYG